MALGTAMAIGGAVASAAQAGVSIAQAQKQKKLQQEAEADAAKAFLKAEDIVQTQFMEEVQVPLEAYGLEAQTNIASQRQGIEALSEGGQRALLGGAGRVAAVGSKSSEEARMAMQQDIYNRDLAIARERQGIRDVQTKMALGEVFGAQQAASDAEYRRMMAQQQALQGIGQALGYGLKATDLYFGMRPDGDTGTGDIGTGDIGTEDIGIEDIGIEDPNIFWENKSSTVSSPGNDFNNMSPYIPSGNKSSFYQERF